MKLSIKNNGKSKFSPEYEFLIDGKPVKRDRLIDITIICQPTVSLEQSSHMKLMN